MKNVILIASLCMFSATINAQNPVPNKPRILISTDIGGTDPDDNQSMTHLLMYSDLFTIEGLVSSPSYGKGNKEEIFRMIDLFEKDFPKLRKHNKDLARPDYLRSITKQGRTGAAPFQGYQTATEGSDWIVKCAQKKSNQPLWILVWGGLDDLAQALHDSPKIQKNIKVYWIGGPNKKWSANSYAYIVKNFPDLWFIEVNSSYYGFFSDNNVPDSVTSSDYDKGETIKTFFNVEPRFNARYILTPSSSIKASYNRMVQYIHLLSNSTLPIPFNTWTPSSPYLEPQVADQVAAGYFKNFKDNTYAFSVEGYYKKLHNVTDFADNANLFLNDDAPAEYRQGESEAYGLEFFLEKTKGKLTGFASYTLSKVQRDIPEVNNDRVFLANYDRRHVFNMLGSYTIDDRWSLGGSFTYSTGRPFTLPTGRYEFDEYNVDLYSGRNAYKLPDFHRLDLSANFEPRKNAQRKWKQTWSFAIYNVYNRKNPYTIFTQTAQDDDGNVIDPNRKEAKMVYLFPILPSLSWKIKF